MLQSFSTITFENIRLKVKLVFLPAHISLSTVGYDGNLMEMLLKEFKVVQNFYFVFLRIILDLDVDLLTEYVMKNRKNLKGTGNAVEIRNAH